MNTMASIQPISVEDLARRFKRSNRFAARLMRRMRHVPGRHPYTTEEWLAEWLAAKSVPAQNWPPVGERLDPLEQAVCSRVIEMMGNLARAGKIVVRMGL